jgi:hypothetical protein
MQSDNLRKLTPKDRSLGTAHTTATGRPFDEKPRGAQLSQVIGFWGLENGGAPRYRQRLQPSYGNVVALSGLGRRLYVTPAAAACAAARTGCAGRLLRHYLHPS